MGTSVGCLLCGACSNKVTGHLFRGAFLVISGLVLDAVARGACDVRGQAFFNALFRPLARPV